MKLKKWVFLLFTILLLIIAGLYTKQAHFYGTHFYPKTVINDVPIGNMTLPEATKRLDETHADDIFSINNGEETWQEINSRQLGLEHDIKPSLEKKLNKQKKFLWLIQRFFKTDVEITDFNLDEEKFNRTTDGLKEALAVLNQDQTAPQDATIIEKDGKLIIQPEVIGETYDLEKVVAEIKTSLSNNKTSINIEKMLVQPKIKSDDSSLKKALEEGEKLTKEPVVYQINGKDIEIPKATIVSWISFNNEEEKVTLDYEKVYGYVQELGAQYDTSVNPTTFKSTKRGEVSVPAGSLSWTIQTDAETNALIEDILKGKGVKRSPIVNGSASASSSLVGQTYVEVDLQNQHMYFYKDGELFLDTAVITGKPTTKTPPGVNYLWKKERDSVLKGTNDDGSKYAEPVSYWMPIDWTGVGLHDSPWQPADAYGGNSWESIGSHGCVNTPPAVAEKLYNNIEVGTPVIVF